jgi:hypothetical protein
MCAEDRDERWELFHKLKAAQLRAIGCSSDWLCDSTSLFVRQRRMIPMNQVAPTVGTRELDHKLHTKAGISSA